MKSLKRSINEYQKWAKKHPVLAWIKPHIYRLPDLPGDIKRSIIAKIQRMRRGWADRDIWCLDYFLAKTIENTIQHLKKNCNGYPGDLTEGKWRDVLNVISETFYIAKKVANGEIYIIKDHKKRKEMDDFLEGCNKKFKTNDRCLSDKQIQDYEKGWKLFKKYFYHLWD